FADARRYTDVDRARLAVVLDREAAHRAVEGVFERELQFVFDVAARPRGAGSRATRAALALAALPAAAEKRLEEIGERVRAAEHVVQVVLSDRPVAAALAGVEAAAERPAGLRAR